MLMFVLLGGIFFASPSFAEQNDYKVLFEKEEIKDEETLYKRAIQGISDVNSNEKEIKNEAKLQGKSKSIPINVHQTTELLKRVKKGDEIIETYKVHAFVDISPEDMSIAASGSKPKTDWDPSGGVKASSNWYYTTSTISGTTHIDQTGSASGSWTVYDYGTTLSNKRYVLGQYGPSKAGCGTCNDTVNGNVSGYSFSKAVPTTSWVPVSASTYTSIGVSMYATVSKGSESWNFSFYNNSNGSGL